MINIEVNLVVIPWPGQDRVRDQMGEGFFLTGLLGSDRVLFLDLSSGCIMIILKHVVWTFLNVLQFTISNSWEKNANCQKFLSRGKKTK